MLIWEDIILGKQVSFLYNHKKILLLKTLNEGGQWYIQEGTFFHYLMEKTYYSTFDEVESAFHRGLTKLITELILGLKTL